MSTSYVVRKGDTMLSIASHHGVIDWTQIWEAPENEALRKLRTNPQILGIGDVVIIPDHRPKEISIDLGARHRFMLRKPALCFFAVVLKDEQGTPYAFLKYTIEVDGIVHEGETDCDGNASAQVSAKAKTAILTLFPNASEPDEKLEWELDLGVLEPVDTLAGVKARLQNLGYLVGPLDSTLDPITQAAIRAFRMSLGLDGTTDTIDDAVRNGLVSQQGEL